jgi:NAD(P)-dependent dehydrogenase (short-subunit alcohol dehydrogenase family)
MSGFEVNQEMMNAFLERLEKNNNLGKIFKPEDVANAVIYLASNEANFINGVNLVIGGGSNF